MEASGRWRARGDTTHGMAEGKNEIVVILPERLALRLQEYVQLLHEAARLAVQQDQKPPFEPDRIQADLEELTDLVEHAELSSVESSIADARRASIRIRSSDGSQEIEFETRSNPSRAYARWTCERCGAEFRQPDLQKHAATHFK